MSKAKKIMLAVCLILILVAVAITFFVFTTGAMDAYSIGHTTIVDHQNGTTLGFSITGEPADLIVVVIDPEKRMFYTTVSKVEMETYGGHVLVAINVSALPKEGYYEFILRKTDLNQLQYSNFVSPVGEQVYDKLVFCGR